MEPLRGQKGFRSSSVQPESHDRNPAGTTEGPDRMVIDPYLLPASVQSSGHDAVPGLLLFYAFNFAAFSTTSSAFPTK